MVNGYCGIVGRSRVHFANGGQSFAENAESDGSGVSDILIFLLPHPHTLFPHSISAADDGDE